MSVWCGSCGLLTVLAVALPAVTLPSAEQITSAEQIIGSVVKRSETQDCELQGYSVMRRYTLRNKHLDGGASMTVRLNYEAGRGKQFSILHKQGLGPVTEHALANLLEDEEKTSKRNPTENAINSSNYQFTLLGNETHDGRLCYRLKLLPRAKSKFLVDGDAWIDAQELAIVAIEGRPAKSLSFWVGRPHIEQHFAPVDGFWMPSRNHTTAQVKLAGETELTIDYWEYRFNLPASATRKTLSCRLTLR